MKPQLQLADTQKSRSLHTNQRLPADVFKKCPACGSKELIPFDGEILCGQCSWDSCRVSVDAGLMDKFFARPHLIQRPDPDKDELSPANRQKFTA